MSEALTHFFDRLDGPRRLSKQAIVDALQRDDTLIHGLIDALDSTDAQVCISAAAVLGQVKDRRAIEPLSRIVADERQFTATRRVAARSLRHIAHHVLFGHNPGHKIPQKTVEKPEPQLPGWLVDELNVLATTEDDAPRVWWLSGGESTMLFAPTSDIDNLARDGLPEWLRISREEMVAIGYRPSELPGWLGR